jgi:prolyl oligopeptidase
MSAFPFRIPIAVPIRRVLHAVTASLIVIAARAIAADPASPPVAAPASPEAAPVRVVSDTHFGVTVQDPYRYLENMKDPEVVPG